MDIQICSSINNSLVLTTALILACYDFKRQINFRIASKIYLIIDFYITIIYNIII